MKRRLGRVPSIMTHGLIILDGLEENTERNKAMTRDVYERAIANVPPADRREVGKFLIQILLCFKSLSIYFSTMDV